MNRSTLCALLTLVLAVAGCEKESGSGPGSGPGASSGSGTGPAGYPAPPATAPATSPAAGGDHPNATPLGQQSVGGLQLVASQDGPVKRGGEGAFDLKITGPTPRAVRFWVGVESGEGSVKGRAEEETPGNWHTHVEVPDPLPPGSKFWVEIEPQQGAKQTASFDLKQ